MQHSGGVCLMRVTCMRSFSVFSHWIRVSRSHLRACVFTHQTESERESVWKKGSQRDLNALINSLSADSKCVPETGDNGTRQERERDIPECVVQSCHFSSAQGQLCHFRTTRLLVSCLECAGSCPNGPFALCPSIPDCCYYSQNPRKSYSCLKNNL